MKVLSVALHHKSVLVVVDLSNSIIINKIQGRWECGILTNLRSDEKGGHFGELSYVILAIVKC